MRHLYFQQFALAAFIAGAPAYFWPHSVAISQDKIDLFAPGMPEYMKPEVIDAFKYPGLKAPNAIFAPAPVGPIENSDPFHPGALNEPTANTNFNSQSATPAPQEFPKDQYEYLKNNAINSLTGEKVQPTNIGTPNQASTTPSSQSAPNYIPPNGSTFITNQSGDLKPSSPGGATTLSSKTSPNLSPPTIVTTPIQTQKLPVLSGFGVTPQDVKKVQSTSSVVASMPTQTSVGDAIGKPSKFIDYSSQIKTTNAVSTPAYRPAPIYRQAPGVNCAQLQMQFRQAVQNTGFMIDPNLYSSANMLDRYCGGIR